MSGERDRLFENVVTLRIVTEQSLPQDTRVSDLSFAVSTHVAALTSTKITSRQMTRAETAAIPPIVREMLAADPDPTAVQ